MMMTLTGRLTSRRTSAWPTEGQDREKTEKEKEMEMEMEMEKEEEKREKKKKLGKFASQANEILEGIFVDFVVAGLDFHGTLSRIN